MQVDNGTQQGNGIGFLLRRVLLHGNMEWLPSLPAQNAHKKVQDRSEKGDEGRPGMGGQMGWLLYRCRRRVAGSLPSAGSTYQHQMGQGVFHGVCG